MKPLRHPAAVAAALSLTLLACGLGGPVAGGLTVTPAFSTATPGGSIVVWLLTTTPTLEGQPEQNATPLAPVATATAEARFAAALTSTAAAPTAIQAVISAPEGCPPLSAAALPADRPPLFRYPDVITRFLASGGTATALEAGLRGWKAITDTGGLLRSDRDMTGDGIPEILLAVLDPTYAGQPLQPGDLLIFGCRNGIYRLLYQAGTSPQRSAPAPLYIDDLNADSLTDLVYSTQTCSGSACMSEVSIIGWNATAGSFGSLAAGNITVFQPKVAISDAGAGLKEIAVTGGISPDPAAGPQRAVTTTLRWNGTQFAVAETLKSPAQYRIHVIHDGDDALRAGDATAAIEAYQRALDATDLLEWGIPDEGPSLTLFARYRLMLAFTLANRLDQAQAAHDALLAQFAPPTPVEGQPTPFPLVGPQPGREFVLMADLFWLNFSVNRDMKRACAGVIDYARATPETLTLLNSFGYANPQYAPEDMCPLGR